MPINISTLIIRIVEKTLTKPSPNFGRLVPIIDDRAMGQLVKEHRLKNNVPGRKIMAELGLSKTGLSFLEIGQKKWDKKTLEAYLSAVEKFKSEIPLAEQKKERHKKSRQKRKQQIKKIMDNRASRAEK